MRRFCAGVFPPTPPRRIASFFQYSTLPGAFPACCGEKPASRGQQCLTWGPEPLATCAVSPGTASVDGEPENTFLGRPWHHSEHRRLTIPSPECGVAWGNGRYVHSKAKVGVGVHTSRHRQRQVAIWFSTRLLCVLARAMPCVDLDVRGRESRFSLLKCSQLPGISGFAQHPSAPGGWLRSPTT